MAGIGFSGRGETGSTLSATTEKTVVQLIAAAACAVDIYEIHVGFAGKVNTDTPCTVKVVRQSDAGTGTSLTLKKENDSDADSLATTAAYDHSVEPTQTDIIRQWKVHPQQGVDWVAPLKKPIHIGKGDRLGITVYSVEGGFKATFTVVGEE